VVCKACGQEFPANLYRDNIEDMKEEMISQLYKKIPSPNKIDTEF
jgi:hypothetical protein